jgi:hypothetical protein
MASITLQGVYLAPVTDLSDTLRINAGAQVSESPDARAEGRRYSAGRVRMVKRVGKDRQVPLSFRRIDRATREQLDEWSGTLLLLRDGRGRKLYGFYSTVSFQEQPGLAFCDASLTFTRVTHDEAV